MIKITSFNANGIRSATRKGFWEWFNAQNIDFLCIQETRAHFLQIESDPIYFPHGYFYDYKDAEKKGYSGVAIYAKQKPLKVIKEIGLDWADREGRYIQFDYENFSIASLYLPSGSSGEARQKFKMQFLDSYKNILKKQVESGKDFIVCGDFNIVHKEIDIKNWRANYGKSSGVLPEEQDWLDYIFHNLGWIDSFRKINQKPLQYTWWSNRGQARTKNIGWRIDYHITTPTLKNKIISGSDHIYTESWFSDHAPLTINYNYKVK